MTALVRKGSSRSIGHAARGILVLSGAIALALVAGCSSDAGGSPSPYGRGSDANGSASSGSGDGNGNASSSPSGDTPAAPDHGAPSTTYPAFTPDMPAVQDNGGGVLTSPEIVTVTWPHDVNADKYETFATQIGASAYWKTIMSEYGVGPATSPAADHVRMSTPLASTILATDIEKIVTDNLGKAPWPAFAAQRIYTLFVPASTKVYDQAGDADDLCTQGAGGYHDEISANGQRIVFAVILMCDGMTVDDATLSASHEWDEASADPHAETAPGFIGLDAQHLAYDLFVQGQDETGDMCEFDDDQAMPGEGDLPFTVQRQWSNKSAASGHAPCVPAAQKTYWNVAGLDAPKDDVTYDLTALDPSYGALAGKGYKLAVGATMAVPFGIYSDAAMDAVDLTVAEMDLDATGAMNPVAGGKNVKLTLDKTSGVNGEKAILTMERTAKSLTDSHLVVVVSTFGGIQHFFPIIVGDDDAAAKVQQGGATPMMRRVHPARVRPRSR